MGFDRFAIRIGVRALGIFCAVATAGYLLGNRGYPVASLLTLILVAALCFELYRFVSRTNNEVGRFLDALKYADFGQRFDYSDTGAGFKELGAQFTEVLNRFRDDRAAHEVEHKHLRALLEQVPVPLLSIYSDDRIELWNHSARRLFSGPPVTRVEDLAYYGDSVARELSALQPGARTLAQFHYESVTQTLSIQSSNIVFGSRRERLVSLQDIQSALDGKEQQAWSDLLRVLTHEIMNSVTPIASLARTSVDLAADIAKGETDTTTSAAELVDLQEALSTVARRSDGLMKFVGNYRSYAQFPKPNVSQFRIAPLIADAARVATLQWNTLNINFASRVTPESLELTADRELVEQVLINLLQNAEHAVLGGTSVRRVELSARLNRAGQVSIEVADSGVGIEDALLEKIFVPFYTTRHDGSGIGLAVSRQIMVAHGGSIDCTNVSSQESTLTGARFTLVF